MPFGTEKNTLFGAAGSGSSGGQIGLFANGYRYPTPQDTIDWVTISSAGDASDFGDDRQNRSGGAGTDNGVNARGILIGGYLVTGDEYSMLISYVTITSAGNAADFGDTSNIKYQTAGLSNGTNDRGIAYGSNRPIDYVTISSTGNAADFGDTYSSASQRGSGISNGTNERGVIPVGFRDGTNTNFIDYITISSLGDGADFGDLSVGRENTSGMSNGTSERGVIAGGSSSNVIDYITISSTGDASDFGDCVDSGGNMQRGGTDSATDNIGVYGGGVSTSTKTIETITISSAGNASDFGDRTVLGQGAKACANSKS
jgi:hypothetical protein